MQSKTGIRILGLALAAMLCISTSAHPQNAGTQATKDNAETDTRDAVARLRIELTGGDEKKPIAGASVYVKFVEKRKLRKEKAFEFDLKTNDQGVTRSPEVPKGRIMIQIVAVGWETYGEWHDVTENEQTIQINLARPTKLH